MIDLKNQNGNESKEPISLAVNLWMHKLKFDTPLKFVFMSFMIFLSVNTIYVGGIGPYIANQRFLSDILIATALLFASYMLKKIPKSFEELIESSYQSIIEEEEVFQNYLAFARGTFNSKREFIVPIFLAILYVLGNALLIGPSVFAGLGPFGEPITNNTIYIQNVVVYVLALVWLFFWVLIVGSALVTIFNAFKCLNRLGTEEFPLSVTYEDLKIGAFDSIGKFIMSVAIPTILFSTVFSILGLYIIILFNDYIGGYSYIGISIVITLLISILLYRNVINIHEAISKYKHELKYNLIKEIEEISLSDMEKFKKYQTITNIHLYYEHIDSVNDWPFNPTSTKKLFITLSSTILPLALSLLGICLIF